MLQKYSISLIVLLSFALAEAKLPKDFRELTEQEVLKLNEEELQEYYELWKKAFSGEIIPWQKEDDANKEDNKKEKAPKRDLLFADFPVDPLVDEITRKSCCTDLILARLACENAIAITPAMIGTTGYVITVPGVYCIANDHVYNPSSTNPAIRISSSNVVILGKYHRLSQINKTVAGVDGIRIDPGLTNIHIQDLTLDGFSRAGIFAPTPGSSVIEITRMNLLNNGTQNTNFAALTGMGGIFMRRCRDVTIDHCDLIGNASAGFAAYEPTKLQITNCHCDDNISSLFITSTSPIGSGIAILAQSADSNDILIRDCTCNRNTAESLAFGLFIGNVFGSPFRNNNVTVENVQASDNQSTVSVANPFAPQTVGINVREANNVVINNCASERNVITLTSTATGTTTTQALGIGVIGNNILINNCSANDNRVVAQVLINTGLTSVAVCAGISVFTVNNFTVSNCQCDGNISSNSTATPFNIQAEGLGVFMANRGLIENCQLSNNRVTVAALPAVIQSRGVDIAVSADIEVRNCFASGHIQTGANPVGQASIAAGFKNTYVNRIIYRNCVSVNNQDLGSGFGFGFSSREGLVLIPPLIDNLIVYENCIAEANTSVNGVGAGLDFRDVTNSKVVNCLFDGNKNGILVSETVAGTAGHNLLTGNILDGNIINGIEDTTTIKTNSYFANRAQNAVALANNYVGLPAGTPIRTWVIGAAPGAPVAGADLDNTSILG